MFADLGEGRLGLLRHRLPVVMKVERRSMIDEIEFAMPHQQVGIARRAIDILREGVEPYRQRGFLGADGVSRGNVEHG